MNLRASTTESARPRRAALPTAFRNLWLGQTISFLGSQVTFLVVPLVAVQTLDARPWQVGLLAAAEGLCYVLLGLQAGAWVDRRSKRPLLLWTSITRALVIALIPVAAVLDVLTFPLLLGVVLVVSVLTMLADLAAFAYVPLLLDPGQLLRGNARLQGSESAAQVSGPALGGVLVQVLSAPLALAVDAVSYLAAAIGVIGAPHDEASKPTEPGLPVRRQILEGLVFIRHQPVVLGLGLLSASYNFFADGIAALVVIYLIRDADVPPAGVGVVFAIVGLGGVLGAAVVSPLVDKLGLWASVRVLPLATAVIGLVLPLGDGGTAAVLVTVALTAHALGLVCFNTGSTTLRQLVTPQAMLGRVRAALRTFSWGLGAVGALLAGVLASALSPRLVLAVCACGLLTSFVLAGLGPLREHIKAAEERSRVAA